MVACIAVIYSIVNHISIGRQCPKIISTTSHPRTSPKTMVTFNSWRPQKRVVHGDRLVSVAREFLATHGAQLSRSRRQRVKELLDHADDHKQVLKGLHLFARIKATRLYVRNARKALQTIKAMIDPHGEAVPLGQTDTPGGCMTARRRETELSISSCGSFLVINPSSESRRL